MKKFLALLSLSSILGSVLFAAPGSYPFTNQSDRFYSIDEEEPVPKTIAQADRPEPKQITGEELGEMREEALDEDRILVRFVEIDVIELLKFISKIAKKNFVFDADELNFKVTVVSDEPTTVDNIMTALLQELRIHGLTMLEKDNNIIIHQNSDVNAISRVATDDPAMREKETEMVTQVFRLNTLEPEKAAMLIRPLTSTSALVEPSETTQHLIITDLESNVREISKLIKSIDSPNSGMVIGQYVVVNAVIDSMIPIVQQIMQPIAGEQQLNFVAHKAANSIFIVSTPFLVERAISIMQNLDQLEGTTRIMDLNEMKFEPGKVFVTPKTPGGPDEQRGRWELDPSGRWVFKPARPPSDLELQKGRWKVDPEEYWYFEPSEVEGPPQTDFPRGDWIKTPQGDLQFQLGPGESISAKKIEREQKISADLPVGHIERTQFYLHKLRFRQGGQIVDALQSIGDSLDLTGRGNEDLISTINSVQWIEASNSLVFTGISDAIAKVKELIEEIDTPLRQVFIEMLIIETDVDDSLSYSVNWLSRFGGGDTSGAQAFLSGASGLPTAADTTPGLPDANTLARTEGYNLGIIGQNLSKNGTIFNTLGALVKALHTDTTTEIILNPKILTEDNSPAEIFVGINTQFKTESISNDEGSVLTNNFEFRDVGTTLKVTPLLGNDDIVTLDIEQEVSNVAQTDQPAEEDLSQFSSGPTTRINRTTTRVHIPNKYFLVLSGMIQKEKIRTRSQVPCLGGLPIVGALFRDKQNTDQKRNLMIFIRPEIIDTEDQIQNLTRRQQNIYDQKNRTRSLWKYEVDEALDLLNIKEDDCGTECK